MNTSAVSSISSVPAGAAFEATAVTRSRSTAFNAAALRNAEPAEQRRAAAAQFEAILVRQLLGKTLTSMLGSDSGVASSVYGDMLSDTISQQLTAGPGLGLGRFLEQQLAPRGAANAGQSPAPSSNP